MKSWLTNKPTTTLQAAGHLGSYFTKWLLHGGKHTVTAVTRAESKAEFPDGVQVRRYERGSHDSLVDALRGQQFLVITLPALVSSGSPDTESLETALIRAAGDAGVEYVMPNAYGPDPVNEAMMRPISIGLPFLAARREMETRGQSKWVALATGFWYEWSLAAGRMGASRFGCDVAARTMTFFDEGEETITTSTWDQCGRALAALLSLPHLPEEEDNDADADTARTAKKTATVDDWANRVVYVASFRVSQKDMFASAVRVTGTSEADWRVEHVDSRERFARAQQRMMTMTGDGDHLEAFSTQMYTRIFFPTGEGDHSRHGLANAALDLPDEDLDEATREGLRLERMGKLTYL